MGHAARGEVFISLSDWIEFVRKYMPVTDGEWTIGPPQQTDCEIVVPFAINTECHPCEEANPPEWIKGKKTSSNPSTSQE